MPHEGIRAVAVLKVRRLCAAGAMKAYETWSKDKNNAGKEFKYEIDTNRPNKENK
ncbi:MAG: hypothetical protein H7221_10250 [Flavobacterium sp.]|nr:hypothetical protein [Flavobacterium sp.]